MKYTKIKIISLLSIIALTLFMFHSCQNNDDNFDKMVTERLVKSRIVSLSELPNANIIDLKIQELGLKRTNNAVGRTAVVDTSYVETDEIIEIGKSKS